MSHAPAPRNPELSPPGSSPTAPAQARGAIPGSPWAGPGAGGAWGVAWGGAGPGGLRSLLEGGPGPQLGGLGAGSEAPPPPSAPGRTASEPTAASPGNGAGLGRPRGHEARPPEGASVLGGGGPSGFRAASAPTLGASPAGAGKPVGPQRSPHFASCPEIPRRKHGRRIRSPTFPHAARPEHHVLFLPRPERTRPSRAHSCRPAGKVPRAGREGAAVRPQS